MSAENRPKDFADKAAEYAKDGQGAIADSVESDLEKAREVRSPIVSPSSAPDSRLVLAAAVGIARRKLVVQVLAAAIATGQIDGVDDDDVAIHGDPAPTNILGAIRFHLAAGVPPGPVLAHQIFAAKWTTKRETDLLAEVAVAGSVPLSDAVLEELREIRGFERDRERDRREAEAAGRLVRALDAGSEELAVIARAELQEVRRDAPRRQDELDLVALCDVEDEPIEWLVPDRIAIGVLNLVAGEPGVGKSLFATKLAAIGSVGGVFPGSAVPCEPFSTLLLAAEDLPARIRARVLAAGGDPSRVILFRGIRLPSGLSGPVNFSEHLSQIERAIERTGARLVVFDPAGAFVGPGVDAHKDHELRPLLEGLARVAERRKVAVLILAHLNKLVGVRASHRVIGGTAWIAASRSALLLAKDGSKQERVVLAAIKSNLAELSKAMAFEIRSAGKGAAPFLELLPGTVETTADALVAVDRPERDGAVGEAVAFFETALAPAGEWRKSAEISKAAEDAGIAPRTLKRARKRLQIEREKRGKEWVIRLPAPEGSQGSQEDLFTKGSGPVGPLPASAEETGGGPQRESA
jgi:hypothetical protein